MEKGVHLYRKCDSDTNLTMCVCKSKRESEVAIGLSCGGAAGMLMYPSTRAPINIPNWNIFSQSIITYKTEGKGTLGSQ
jgi:hypothetical protein